MDTVTELKDHLHHYLKEHRKALLLKADGVPERELRLPRTPTGTSLLGILKHCANVQFGYFGPTFDRMIDDPRGLLDPSDYESDPQADWYATESESASDVIDLFRRVSAFADTTIEALDIDAPGSVPWWGPGNEVTLGQIMIHVLIDLARHAGQADILREEVDGAVGWMGPNDNVPDDYDWPAYVAKLTAIADRF